MASSPRVFLRSLILAAFFAVLGLQVLRVSAEYEKARFVKAPSGLALDRNGDGVEKFIVRMPRKKCTQDFDITVKPKNDVDVDIGKLRDKVLKEQEEKSGKQVDLLYLNNFVTKFCGRPKSQFVNVRGLGLTDPKAAPYFQCVLGYFQGVKGTQTLTPETAKVRVVIPEISNMLATNLSLAFNELCEQQIRISPTISAYTMSVLCLGTLDKIIEEILDVVVANMVSYTTGPSYCLSNQQGQIGGVVTVEVGKVLQSRPDLTLTLVGGLLGNVNCLVQELLDGLGNLVNGVVLTLDQLLSNLGNIVGVVLDDVVDLLNGVLGGLLGGLLGGGGFLFGGGGPCDICAG